MENTLSFEFFAVLGLPFAFGTEDRVRQVEKK